METRDLPKMKEGKRELVAAGTASATTVEAASPMARYNRKKRSSFIGAN